uniref:Neural cell adhesion molecule 1 n=1 Tax=Aquila chrysaetos chrysaetos TaxID=223781 RepID=A0A663E6Y5_AQUCH
MITITGLKPETTYSVRLSAVNGKGVGEISLPSDFKTQPVRIPHSPTQPLAESESSEPPTGEPSAPKLEGQMGEDGNSIKVNVIKQDDGGSPIRHYLIKYKAKHSSEWKPEIRLPSGSDHVMLKSLDWNAEYEVYVIAENQQGKSKPAHYAFRTSAQPTVIPATLGSPSTSSSFVSLLLSAVTLLLLC